MVPRRVTTASAPGLWHSHHGRGRGISRKFEPVLVLAVGCLLLCLLLLSSAVAGESVEQLATLDTTLICVATTTVQSLLEDYAALYRLVRPNLVITCAYGTSSVVQPKLLGGYVDFGVMSTDAALTPAQIVQYPDIVQLPLFTQQTTIAYNTPDLPKYLASGAAAPNLIFSVLTLSRIFSANITRWNDPQILAENPTLQASFPDRPIQLVMADRYSATGQDVLCTVFTREDPDFAGRFPCTSSSNFIPPIASYGLPPIQATAYTDRIQAIATTDWSMGFSSLIQAQSAGLAQADIINMQGTQITPTLLSASLPTYEVGFPLVQGAADLTLAQGPNAYPFVQYIYLQISSTYSRGTCTQKQELVNFFLWIYTNPVASQMADVQISPLLPAGVRDALDIVNILETEIYCKPSTPVYVQDAVSNGKIVGLNTIDNVIPVLLELYSAYNSGVDYTFEIGSEVLSFVVINQGPSSGYDAAITSSPTEDDDDGVNHLSLPLLSTSSRLVYSLPTGLTFADTGPIVLDLETVGQIYNAQINSWLHPRITRFNPRLTAALLANPSINSNLTVVLCCSVERGTLPVRNVIRRALDKTSWGTGLVAKSYPTNWDALWNSALTNVTWITADYEVRVPAFVERTPGSIGYALMDSSEPDDTLHIRLMPWKGNSAASEIPDSELVGGYYPYALNDSVSASVLRAADCASDTSGLTANLMANGYLDWSAVPPSTCWPLTLALQMLLPTKYSNLGTTPRCTQGKQTLNLLKWLASSSILTSMLQSHGIARFADAPTIQTFVTNSLNAVECDGETMLVAKPHIWELETMIEQMAKGWSISLIILLGLTAIVVAYNRTSPSIHASGVRILGVMLVGLIMLFVSAILWATARIPMGSCDAFHWAMEIGFTLAFLPIALKIWRVDRRLNKARQVAERTNKKKMTTAVGTGGGKGKLTDFKLMLLVLGALGLDFLFLGVMQRHRGSGFDLLVSTESMSGGRIMQYTQCVPGSDADVPLALLLASKAVWIIWATLMTFSYSEASTLAADIEAKQLAYALYNLVFTTFIIVPITMLLNPRGTVLVLLIVILVMWIATVAAVCIFAPKLFRIVQLTRDILAVPTGGSALDNTSQTGAGMSLLNKQPEGKLTVEGKSSRGNSKLAAFSFVQFEALARETLRRYLLALDRHIINSKRRLNLLGGLHMLSGLGDYRTPLAGEDSYDVSDTQSQLTTNDSSGSHLSGSTARFQIGRNFTVRDASVRVSLSNTMMRPNGAVGGGSGTTTTLHSRAGSPTLHPNQQAFLQTQMSRNNSPLPGTSAMIHPLVATGSPRSAISPVVIAASNAVITVHRSGDSDPTSPTNSGCSSPTPEGRLALGLHRPSPLSTTGGGGIVTIKTGPLGLAPRLKGRSHSQQSSPYTEPLSAPARPDNFQAASTTSSFRVEVNPNSNFGHATLLSPSNREIDIETCQPAAAHT